MKKLTHIFSIAFLTICVSTGCDDQIYPELPSSDPILTIDAWINNLSQNQVITVASTQPYFDNNQYAGVTGAQVYIMDSEGVRFDFIEGENGEYIWTPLPGESFGTIGTSYSLNVEYEGVSFLSSSKMNRVPPVDSVTFRHELNEFIQGEDAFIAEFWSKELEGPGDTYWIKTFKNEEFLSKPSEINIAYDAAFSAGGNYDGELFIPPIRENINPLDEYEEGNGDEFHPPYEDGDSIYVEIHSIPNEAFNFLTQVITQTDRPGGFAEFFAKPLSNIETNITSDDGTQVLGFFCVSAVEGNGTRLDTSVVPREEE